MRGCTPLTQEERYQVQALMKAGHNQTEMATLLEATPELFSQSWEHAAAV